MPPLCEVRVFSRRHQYAGTIDVLGLWQGAVAVIDYKTGDPRDVVANLQTAAYAEALREMLDRGDTPEQIGFDVASHRYTLDGERLPSVTGILRAQNLVDFSNIPASILLPAVARGTAVHLACHYYNDNDINIAEYQAEYPDKWPYLESWIAFRRDSGFVLAHSFAELVALPIRRYAVRLQRSGIPIVERYDPHSSDFREFLGLRTACAIRAKYQRPWHELLELEPQAEVTHG